MKFGFTLKPEHRFDRAVDFARRAETSSRSSGTATRPIFGSIVQNG